MAWHFGKTDFRQAKRRSAMADVIWHVYEAPIESVRQESSATVQLLDEAFLMDHGPTGIDVQCSSHT